MKILKNLKKNEKIIYTALGAITLGVIGAFSISGNTISMENWR